MKLVDQGREHALAVYRIVLGFLFCCHGAKLLFGIFGAKGPVTFGVWPSWWASMIQLVGGAAVMLGIGTRIAALLCSGSMAYAYFSVHQPDALLPIENGGEISAIFAFGFLLIAILGAGSWALSSVFQRSTADGPATPSTAQMETAS
ncbi:DoxX family protein [Amycolatopsis sp.]|jgi:putative oxidoreductase|uniref:DoxX family protein n=1 Tax=Amycolatopsis sp. TaxID=37632 RepID=UPI002E0C2156|nr:DoxX family protein [Amycolatopsis sp.]